MHEKEIRRAKNVYVLRERSVLSAQMLKVFLIGVGTVLRLERDA